jgi:hypothetical protein
MKRVRAKIIAVPVLALIVVGVAFVSRHRRSATPNGVTSATTQTETQQLAIPTDLPDAPTQRRTMPPTNLLHVVRASDLSASEREDMAKKLREKFRPAMQRWANAYGDRLPIAPDDVTMDKFVERIGDSLYTFVLGDFTLTFDESKDSAKVSYLASRKAVIQLNKSPTGEEPKTDLPITREEIARMVQADTGVSFKPNEILMTPTGIGFAMNGGANIRIGPPKNAAPAVSGPNKLSMVVGPDGKLAYYMRDPFF